MQILNTIVTLLISLCVIATIFGVITSIIMFIVAATEKEPVQKKKIRKWALWIFLGPIIALLLILILWGLVAVVTHTFNG